MVEATRTNRKAWFYFALLLVVFIGPIIVSYGLYTFRNFVPETLSNGHLILPPLNFKSLSLQDSQGQTVKYSEFKGDWLMVYIEPGKCNKACLDTLYKMRQVRTRLGKNMNRVKRVILTEQGQADKALNEYLTSPYKGTFHVQVNKAQLSKFLEKLPSHDIAMKEGYLYLVDPLGNLMMSYNPVQKPKAVYSDLKRLLKASRIG